MASSDNFYNDRSVFNPFEEIYTSYTFSATATGNYFLSDDNGNKISLGNSLFLEAILNSVVGADIVGAGTVQLALLNTTGAATTNLGGVSANTAATLNGAGYKTTTNQRVTYSSPPVSTDNVFLGFVVAGAAITSGTLNVYVKTAGLRKYP